MKRRRIDKRGYIDIDLPIWLDLFSIIMLYLCDKDLLNLNQTSKRMNEIVTKRGTFSSIFGVSNFQRFYYNTIKISKFLFGKFKNNTDQIYEFIEKQKYIKKIKCYANDFIPFDWTVFLRRNVYGRLNNPMIKTISYILNGEDIDYFVKFLEEYPGIFEQFEISMFDGPPSRHNLILDLQMVMSLVKSKVIIFDSLIFE